MFLEKLFNWKDTKMVKIIRKRNSGKTTMLLHYMVCNPYSVMICKNEFTCERRRRDVKGLDLDIRDDRFVSMTKVFGCGKLTLIADDLDVMMQGRPDIVADFIGRVAIATMAGI